MDMNTSTPAVKPTDWRATMTPNTREGIVNKVMESMKKSLPFTGEEDVKDLKNIAERFEEKIYTAATSQSDHVRKISLNMLKVESKLQPLNSTANQRQPSEGLSSLNMLGYPQFQQLPRLQQQLQQQQQQQQRHHQQQQLFMNWRSQLQQQVQLRKMQHPQYYPMQQNVASSANVMSTSLNAQNLQASSVKQSTRSVLEEQQRMINQMIAKHRKQLDSLSDLQKQTQQQLLETQSFGNNINSSIMQQQQSMIGFCPQSSLPSSQGRHFVPQQLAPVQPMFDIDSKVQTSQTNGMDWQEEVLQKIKDELE